MLKWIRCHCQFSKKAIVNMLAISALLLLLSGIAFLPATAEIPSNKWIGNIARWVGASLFMGLYLQQKGKTAAVYIQFFFFAALYMSVSYLKLVEGMTLPRAELMQSFTMSAAVFLAVSYVQEGSRALHGWPGLAAKVFSYLLTLFCLVPPLLVWGYFAVSGHLLTTDIVLTLFQTNIGEAMAYIASQGYLLWGIASLCLCAVIVGMTIWFQKSPAHFSRRQFYQMGLLVVAALALFPPESRDFYIYRLYGDTKAALKSFSAYDATRTARLQHLSDLGTLSIAPGKAGLYVLVIGESVTRDHMGAYGYDRDTTPWMSSAAGKELLLFRHAYSNHTQTVPVLTYALTAKNQYNDIPLEKAYSIIETARSAGYDTWWISNQLKYGAWDTPIAAIASTADHEVWINKNAGTHLQTQYYDEELLSALPDLSYEGPRLIIFHLMGSHGTYEDRYPAEEQIFTGTSREDAYDNTIHYTDQVLRDIYRAVSAAPHFQAMMYMSDHGEDPESGHEVTKFKWTMARIPFFLALSPERRNSDPEEWNLLQSRLNTYWTNDLAYNLFNHLMGVQGLPDDGVNDFLSPAYDGDPHRLMTIHGKKWIADDPDR